jgi:short-subunit dehydrogenase
MTPHMSWLTVVVNNAGLSRGQTIVEGTYSDNIITLKTNLLAPFLLSKEFLPNMIQQNHGHIFNVASMSAYIPSPGIADYAASKAGLIAFNEVWPDTPSKSTLSTYSLCSVCPKSSECRMRSKFAHRLQCWVLQRHLFSKERRTSLDF